MEKSCPATPIHDVRMALSEKSKPMNVFLDVQEMEFDENGVKNFFWPISRSEFDSARDALLSGIAKAAKAQGNTLDGERDLFATFCHFVCYEALACYQAYALNRRTTSAGHKLVWRKNSRLFPLISDGRAPRVQESELVRTLHNGPRCHPWYLRPLVKLRRSIRWNGFNFHGLRPARPQGDIIACHATEVLEYHAQAVPETVKYTLFGEWFSPINQGDEAVRRQPPLAEEVVLQAVQAIDDAFHAGGETLPEFLRSYFEELIRTAGPLARYHLERVLARPRKVPRHLWTGTGGYIWNRLLRHAVRRLGGAVTGHEHGTGEGHVAYFNTKAFMDYESADMFMTFNEAQADGLRLVLEERYLIPRQRPEIVSVPKCPSVVKYASDVARYRTDVRSRTGCSRVVMYVPTVYCGEKPRLAQHNEDMVMADWQARLLAKLKAWHYPVLYKAHPQGDSRPPAGFADCFGVKSVDGLLQESWDTADILLFDFINTTAFSVALNTNRPIVFIDFGYDRFLSKAYTDIERRCTIVRGQVDEYNRLQVDWDELRKALEQPLESTDRSFLESHLKFAQ